MSRPVHLNAVLKTTALTTPLKDGSLKSDQVTLDFTEINPIHRAFAPMVREAAFDLSELAIVTALQAVAFKRPVVLLPVVVASRFQRGCLISYRPHGEVKPEQLRGKRIGVRSYTQTTGMWVRAHLVEDYGLATPDIRWITHDPAHVEQYQDPPFVEHPAHGKGLLEMLHAGDIDAAIFGNDLPEGDDYVPVIANAKASDQAWAQQHGFVPINHVVAVSADICTREPAAVRAAYNLLAQAEHQQPAPEVGPRKTLSGFDALRAPLAWIIDACLEQALLPRKLSLDEVLGPADALLKGNMA
jgi:4,5-dihydroxyphthalate decarboxylase